VAVKPLHGGCVVAMMDVLTWLPLHGLCVCVSRSHDLALKLQQEEDLNAAAAVASPASSSQVSLRQPRATASAASNIDKPDKKSDNVSIVTSSLSSLGHVCSCICSVCLVTQSLHFIATHSELQKVLFLVPSVCHFFLFVYEISRGTAERICSKFPRKTCLVPRSDEFEGLGHHGQKTAFFSPFGFLRAVSVS